ncbi:MAG: hypothetical protein KDH96_13210, partial [Candidatus Riesia sp.]|nr:hypothetical protein [Candidatus Riesia sp.]
TTGYGMHARKILKPLIDGGATIKLIPDEDYIPPHLKIDDPYWKEQIEKSKSMPDNQAQVSFCIPNRARFIKGINTVFTSWETNRLPNEWVPILNNADHVVFPSKAILEVAKNSGVTTPGMVISPSIPDVIPDDKLEVNEIPDDAVKFVFSGNFIPRKNFEQLLTAFYCAFSNVKDVGLIIKTWAHDNSPNMKKHIADSMRHLSGKIRGIPNKPKISVIPDLLSEDQVTALINSADVYVSLSRGEGYDYNMVLAMGMGKIVIGNDFLAHGDYMNKDNSMIVSHTLEPITDPTAPLYQSYQMWSSTNMEQMIQFMQIAYSLVKEKNSTMGAIAKKDVYWYRESNNTPKIADVLRKVMVK